MVNSINSIDDLDEQPVMVHGRLRKPFASLTVLDDGIARIRIDDHGADEFWARVELTRPQVEWILARMDAVGQHGK